VPSWKEGTHRRRMRPKVKGGAGVADTRDLGYVGPRPPASHAGDDID
jgi:hypothetical protein